MLCLKIKSVLVHGKGHGGEGGIEKCREGSRPVWLEQGAHVRKHLVKTFAFSECYKCDLGEVCKSAGDQSRGQ